MYRLSVGARRRWLPTMTVLAAPTARAMRWPVFGAVALLGLGIAAIPALFAVELDRASLVTLVRAAAVCAGLGVAFLLDDPAAESTRTVPTPRLLRYAVRVCLALPVAAGWWLAAVLAVVAAPGESAARLPLGGLTLEAAAVGAVSLAVAAVVLRRTGGGTAGTLAAPALLLLMAGVKVLPGRLALVVDPDGPRWGDAHRGWALVLAAAVVVAVWAGVEPVRVGSRVPADSRRLIPW